LEFNNIKAEIKSVILDTLRIDNEDYLEIVIKKTSLENIMKKLEGIFGLPARPSSKKLSKEIEKLIKNMGGIREGQTLYLLEKEGCAAFAMLWPWQDGERITVKLAKI